MPRISIATRRKRIRHEIAGLKSGGQRRYPEALRRRIIDYARLRLDAGAAVATVCTELGVSHPTMSRLLNVAPAPIRRVRVAQSTVVAEQPTELVVRGPGGVRVEGLDIEGVADLIRMLS